MKTLAGEANMEWQVEKFENQYHDLKREMLPISTNIILVYANAELTEDDVTVTKTIMFYAGLYYNSNGWMLARSISAPLAGDDPPGSYPIVKIGIATYVPFSSFPSFFTRA